MSLLTIKVVVATFGVVGVACAVPLGILSSKSVTSITVDNSEKKKYCPQLEETTVNYGAGYSLIDYEVQYSTDTNSQQDGDISFVDCRAR